ncbi:AraC family transcriptional regulator ligand-binding domain-containing protein [Amphritea sp.]|uniref:AraC family transcriptional regulator n=1 Tax=Amphritea sp. TaxID=1872502 RepID=UPI003564E2F1
MTTTERTKAPLLIDSHYLLGTLEAAQELDINIDEVLDQYGIPPKLLVEPEGFLAFTKVARFLDKVAKEFDCPQFGFLVGKHQPPFNLGLLSQVMKLSPNLGSALNSIDKYIPLYSQAATWGLQSLDDKVALTRRDRIGRKESGVQSRNLTMVQAFKALKVLCGPQWAPSAIYLAHRPLGNKRTYEHFYKAPVYFDREYDAIVFQEEDLKRPIVTADARLLEIVQSHLSSLLDGFNPDDDIATEVRYHIRCRLGTRTCNLDSISQLLALSPRSLKRKLAKHHYTFTSILASVRQEVAVEYLRDSQISLIDLADMLGYQNASAFSRAFKNSFGMAPDHWRKTQSKR